MTVADQLPAEELIPLAKLVHEMPTEAAVGPDAIRKWIQQGVTAHDGRKIKLWGRRMGRLWYSIARALATFLDELNGVNSHGGE